jgi:hypothetical protein
MRNARFGLGAIVLTAAALAIPLRSHALPSEAAGPSLSGPAGDGRGPRHDTVRTSDVVKLKLDDRPYVGPHGPRPKKVAMPEPGSLSLLALGLGGLTLLWRRRHLR